ncbi:MAG TPA: c-type cytochrome [Rhodanobacteraceae bacterium]|nr:c-type cytochrome [Rhodanobacteraceae bacterium]
MSGSRLIALACLAGLGAAGWVYAAGAQDYHLGDAATPQQIAGWNIDVRPDGQGLPPGQGSVAQGEKVFDANCAVCHGTFGESNKYMVLAGGVGSLKSDAPLSTVGSRLNFATTLFDYINRAMPFPRSKSLTADEVYAVSAYVLNLNDIVPADFVASRATLPQVKMPNRDGFYEFPGLMQVHGKPDTHNTACMRDCAKDVAITGSIPAGFVESMYGDIRDNFRGLATMNDQAPPAGEALQGKADVAPQALIQQFGCAGCHGIDKTIVGPAFRSVADKYKSDPGAEQRLEKKVRSGGSGVWGSIPMPPQDGPSDAELAAIIRWVLAGAPEQ